MFNEINFNNSNNQYQSNEHPSNEFVTSFNAMPNDVLVSFASNEGFSFTPDQLFFIRNYFLNEKRAAPTITQLRFFDALNNRRRKNKSDFPIISVSAPDGSAKEILATSQDFLAKKAVINKKVYGAMPLSFASEIASEFLKYAGINEKNSYFAPSSEKDPKGYYINAEDSEAIFTYTDSVISTIQQEPLQNAQGRMLNNAIVMLCPMSPMDHEEYESRANLFLSLPEVVPMISDRNTIGAEYTIFDLLKNERDGVFADISRIPDIEKNEYGRINSLMPLLEASYGRDVFATSFASLAMINRISGAYGLMLCHFAIRNDTKALTLDATRAPIFSFDFNFIDAIESFKEPKEYVFSDECKIALGAKKKAFLIDNRNGEKQSFRAERILNFGKVIASATSRELGESPFKTASITVLDAITTLVAKGVPLSDVSLLIDYSLLGKTDDKTELGKNLSAILGAYRAMIEVCVSDSVPQITYNTTNRSITVLSMAKPPVRKLNNTFVDGNSYLYFIPYQFDENGFVRYDKYRASNRQYYSYLERDAVLSAFAISENISVVVNNVKGNASINYADGFEIESYVSAHGIIFESKTELEANENLVFVGKTVQNISDIQLSNDNIEN